MPSQGLLFILQARHLANLHDVEAERRAMYARPDCPPLPAAPEPDPGARRRALLFHGLRQRLTGPTRP